jgi:hypothetical protein
MHVCLTRDSRHATAASAVSVSVYHHEFDALSVFPLTESRLNLAYPIEFV